MKSQTRLRYGLAAMTIALLVAPGGCKVGKRGGLERTVAQFVKQDVTVGGGTDINPFVPTPANIAEGQRHFFRHCSMCHGLDGAGTGVPFADNMSPPIPPLSAHGIQDYEDGQLRWIIRNGIYPSGMPSWDGVLSDEKIWKIVIYIRHLPPEGSLGVPEFYKGINADSKAARVFENRTDESVRANEDAEERTIILQLLREPVR
jgi:mono/diheme cytochrome c family protein